MTHSPAEMEEEYAVAVFVPDITKAVTHIRLQQHKLMAFLRDAKELRDEAQDMYEETRYITEGRCNALESLWRKFQNLRRNYGLPEAHRTAAPLDEDIPLAEKMQPILVDADDAPKLRSSEKKRGANKGKKPKVVSVKKISPKQAAEIQRKLSSANTSKETSASKKPVTSTPLRYEEVYTDSESDVAEEPIQRESTPRAKREKPPISEYVSQGISKIIAQQPQASTSAQNTPVDKPKSVEEQIVAWNKRLANIYKKPDPRVPVRILLPQVGAHWAKSDPRYGTFQSNELKSWIEWNQGRPWLNIERFRDEGGRYTDITDPDRQIKVDRRLVLPSTWRKHHKRLMNAVTALEDKLRTQQPQVLLENLDDAELEAADVSHRQEDSLDNGESTPPIPGRKRCHISSDAERHDGESADNTITHPPKPYKMPRQTARKSFSAARPLDSPLPMSTIIPAANTDDSMLPTEEPPTYESAEEEDIPELPSNLNFPAQETAKPESPLVIPSSKLPESGDEPAIEETMASPVMSSSKEQQQPDGK